jgi:hypothetical protein
MTVDTPAATRATAAVPGIPQDDEGPVFREPWEAQAFAMGVVLHGRGVNAMNRGEPEFRYLSMGHFWRRAAV